MTATPMQSASTSMVHLAVNVKQDIMATQNNQDCGLMEETVLVSYSPVQLLYIWLFSHYGFWWIFFTFLHQQTNLLVLDSHCHIHVFFKNNEKKNLQSIGIAH